jgi:hypothetical protein
MLVRFVGFNFNVEGKGVLNLATFARAMTNIKPLEDTESEDRRLLFMNDQHHADYYVGLIVTIKDRRTFCELVSTDGNLLVKVNQLNHDSSLMDFNFFVLNKVTGAGLYQHYHQSCSVTAFATIAAQRFADHRNLETQKAIASAKDASEAQSKIESRYSNRLRWEVIVRTDALKAMIAEMKRVKAFEYCLSTPVVKEDAFTPLRPFVKRKLERLTFTIGTPVQLVATALDAFVSSANLDKGRVECLDEHGIERILRIVDNPDSFGEYEYDDIAPKLNELDLTNFHASWLIKELIEKCKANKAIFEYRPSS